MSFIGFAPADDPQIALLVLLDSPGNGSGIYVSGGQMAAPTVGKMFADILPYMGIEPVYDTDEQQKIDKAVPALKGLSVDDARAELSESGFECRLIGSGSMVTDQLPAANAVIADGSTVIIYAGAEPSAGLETMPVRRLERDGMVKTLSALADGTVLLTGLRYDGNNDAEEVFAEFKELTGREYHLVDQYMCDDADYVAIILGSSYGTMKATVDALRAEGIKVGCAMPRVYRPWPEAALAEVMKGKKGVAVFDKHLSIGAYGPMFPEVVTAAAGLDQMPKMYNVIYGLGGADATVAGFKKMMEEISEDKANKITYLGVKA